MTDPTPIPVWTLFGTTLSPAQQLDLANARAEKFRKRFRNAERRITAARKWLRLGQVHKALNAMERYPK